MTGFIFILGFTLASSIPDKGIPLSGLCEFWVSRIAPAHATFVLQVLISFAQWRMRCDRNAPACRSTGYTVMQVVETILTTRSSAHDHFSGQLWFVGKMYWFIVWSPLVHRAVARLGPRQAAAGLAWCLCANMLHVPFWATVDTIPKPYTCQNWAACFLAGFLAWHRFRHGLWRGRAGCWAAITDACSLLLLGCAAAVYLDECWPRPSRGMPFDYECKEGAYHEWREAANRFAQDRYWISRNMLWLSVYRLSTPLLAPWIYGLAVGEGLTARLLSRPLLARRLAPLCFGVYIMEVPISWCWLYATKGLSDFTPWFYFNNLPFPLQFPISYQAAATVLLLSFGFSWFLDQYVNAWLVPLMVRAMSLGLSPLRWLLGGAAEPEARGALAEVQHCVQELTGAAPAPDDRLEDLGLDSFGVVSLVGMLRARSPQLGGLGPGLLRSLGTVRALAEHLEAQAKARKRE